MLAEHISEDRIITDLKSRDKRGIMEEMLVTISSDHAFDRQKALDSILDRERLGSTGIGHGVAIPHGKLRGLGGIKVCLGLSRAGVDFDSTDKLPVHIVFLIMTPENSALQHLKLLASISRLLKSNDFRVRLMRASGRGEILSLIAEAERRSGMA